jgi:hypothetical protein
MNTKETLDNYVNHIADIFKSSLYFFSLFQHLNQSSWIDIYWKYIAKRNANLRNDFSWILWKDSCIAYRNIAIIQLYWIFESWEDCFNLDELNKYIRENLDEINNIAFEYYKQKNILENYRGFQLENLNSLFKKIKPFRVKIENDLRNLRDVLSHNLTANKVKKKKYIVNTKDIEKIWEILWEILNEITVFYKRSSFHFDWFSKNIKTDYESLFDVLDKEKRIRKLIIWIAYEWWNSDSLVDDLRKIYKFV